MASLSSRGSFPQPPQRDSWFAPLSVDLLVKVANVTIFHPFVAALVPLCLRARAMMWDAPEMLGAFAWAAFVSLLWVANAVNQRIAHGAPRDVDLGEEVIVITGGASGLGMLVAEVYGMRGATVAVLDINEMENGEARGVTFYKCDVSDSKQVAAAALKIEQDVSYGGRGYARTTRCTGRCGLLDMMLTRLNSLVHLLYSSTMPQL